MVRFPMPSLPKITLPSEHAVVTAIRSPFAEARDAASYGFSVVGAQTRSRISATRGGIAIIGNEAEKVYNAPLPNQLEFGRNSTLMAIAQRSSALQRAGASFARSYEPLFGGQRAIGATTLGGLASVIGGGVFAALPVGGPEDDAARAAVEGGAYGTRDGGAFFLGHAEEEGEAVAKGGAEGADEARAAAVGLRTDAAETGEKLAEAPKSWYQSLRPSLQFAAKAGVYGGAVVGAGYGIGLGVKAAGSGIGAGLQAVGTGAGQGVANLLGLGSNTGSGSGSSGGGSSGGTTGGAEGILGEVASSPLILLLLVGGGLYLIVKHEGKKSSSSGTSSSGSAS